MLLVASPKIAPSTVPRCTLSPPRLAFASRPAFGCNVSSYCSEPTWNPIKENLIAFTAAVSGGFQIALYDFKTRSSQILTTVSQSAVEPTWMNDGRHLVFTQRQNGRMRLMLLDIETKKVSSLHVPDFGDASSASFVY